MNDKEASQKNTTQTAEQPHYHAPDFDLSLLRMVDVRLRIDRLAKRFYAKGMAKREQAR